MHDVSAANNTDRTDIAIARTADIFEKRSEDILVRNLLNLLFFILSDIFYRVG